MYLQVVIGEFGGVEGVNLLHEMDTKKLSKLILCRYS